jgi:hypothetical protein
MTASRVLRWSEQIAMSSGSSVGDGETVILQLDAKGRYAVLARIPIEEWPRLR